MKQPTDPNATPAPRPDRPAPPAPADHDEALIDEALDESFPASDPPAYRGEEHPEHHHPAR
jgi:hypothetical protein